MGGGGGIMEFVTPVNNKNNFCLKSGKNHFFR